MPLVARSFALLLSTLISSQLLLDAQHTDTVVEACSCDLKKGACDVACCCDVDCLASDLKAFQCPGSESIDIPLETTCFKDLPVYRSNSPHAVRTRDGLICVDHPRKNNDSYYEKLVEEKIAASVTSRAASVSGGVSLPTGTPTELTSYKLGTSIFRYIQVNSLTTYYTLPASSFGSATCLGSQTITYLNDFTSTCTQPVTEQTCLNALDSTKYTSGFCLVKNPTTLSGTTIDNICCTASGAPSSWSSGTCNNALKTLTLTINYSTANGIESCNVSITPETSSTTVEQSLSVTFARIGTTAPTSRRSGNPGYPQGSAILAGTLTGSTISTSAFSIAQASADGSCSTSSRTTIRFGENRQSVCTFGNSTATSCPDISSATNIFMPFDPANFRVGAFANADPSDASTNWLPVTYCTSEAGSSAEAVCQRGAVVAPSTTQCYNRLDIQIAYANIGSVGNPQPIIGAIVLHYRRITTGTTSVAAPWLLTQTVTFQDVSSLPATEGDHLPRPNTRQPGDFFYAFFRNQATSVNSFSSFACLSLALLLTVFIS